MEDYDKFVQLRLSLLSKSEEEEEEQPRPSSASSLIRFYGRPILPPLLSGKQREEMQRHRDEAQKAAINRKLKDDPRMAFVQTILHSVQLRKTPTLEDLLQESESNTNSGFQSNAFVETKDSLSPSPVRKEKDVFPPLTSTTYSAFFASHVTTQQHHHKGCLTEKPNSQQESPPSSFNGANQQSHSSGYLTYENVDEGSESRGFGSSTNVYNMGGFFLHNTSNTIAKMPDIISHPPIDGEELERSGLESSFGNNFIEVKDIHSTSFQEDSAICDHLLAEESDGAEHDINEPFTSVPQPNKEGNLDQTDGLYSLSEKSGFSDNPSETVGTHQCPGIELHIQHDPREAANQVDMENSEPSEEPYRLSLQVLLKKSQEYRRRQRMLRNQAKNTKIQERTQEQPRAEAEEQSLSDKENDEFLHKGTVTAEGKRTKERRGTFIPSMETSPKKSGENEIMKESELVGKKMNVTHLTEDGDTTFRNKLNTSQEVMRKPGQISAFIQQQPTAQDAFDLTTSPTGTGRYCTVPTPNVCTSPVHCKSNDSVKDGHAADGAETLGGEFIVSTCFNGDHMAGEINLGHKNSHTAHNSSMNLVVEENVTSVLAKSSQHIDQLESNLCSLKMLISDLESTVKENMDSRCQSENNTPSERSFNGIKHSEQIRNDQHVQLGENDTWEEKQREKDDSNDAEWLKRQSGLEPAVSDAVNFSELNLHKTFPTESERGKPMCKEGLSKRSRQHGGFKKQLPTKCILSVAQQMHIPDIFRNAPPETGTPSEVSVLSDTSNHLMDRKNEIATERHDSICSPSLNQSYDVDRPSCQWFLERSECDVISQGHLVQKTDLTPESEGESQGGLSKVKRRLLIQMTEDSQERSPDTRGGGGGSVVRHNSSTPRAAMNWHEGHSSQKNRQEQLKQAHAAQVRAMQEEHWKQQEELLQALAVRYRLLQSVSFPCSLSDSRPGDTMTFSTFSQQSSPPPHRCCHLLSAAVKGFLTRRLLKTERVVQLVRTIRDTQQFLQAFQQQSHGRGELLCSRQDLLLQERVSLQLRAARYEVHDVFFSLSTRQQMQLISLDRELAWERELRRQSGHSGHPRGKSTLSAATRKSLERKKGVMIQKKTAEGNRAVMMRAGPKPRFPAEKQQETKRGQFRGNSQRIPKSTSSSRP
ncbi:centriolar coiled-coil protein of 110 kDa [Parambassis ranga]|uniref:Centriolar coiled-coil protein of 110 kDa n=1 Tax=Parambassis ranga TaxID=210632 RepID=A0A6P7IXI6_9TELE|nr:centriolar coiled-coil protein of 110 kDa-like [Parambassis ranga]